MEKSIKGQLISLAAPAYQKFESRLLPGVSNILKARLPNLRICAKKTAKGDWKANLALMDGDVF